MIEQESIDELKSKLDIVDTISQYVKLKKTGINYVGLCPFHDEKTPSFNVNRSRGIYKCFGCNKGGDVIKFVMEIENKPYIETIRLLADKNNFTLKEFYTKDKNRTLVRPILKSTSLKEQTINYFKDTRGISEDTLRAFKVTDAVEWMPKAQSEIDVICFNYYLNSELVNIKYRGKNKDFKTVKDAKLIFYNVDAVKDEKEIIICEGEVDAMSFHQAGMTNVISVPNGGAVGNLNLEYFDNCFDFFLDKERIILATDNDEVGIRLRDELARRFGKDRCLKVNYPKQECVKTKDGVYRACKDANEILVYLGEESLRDLVLSAHEYPIEGILTVEDDLFDDVVDFWENGYPVGMSIGVEKFDDLLKFQPGQYTTITGIPGSGKSEFIDLLIARSIDNHNWKWGICSFENAPSSIHVTKIMQKLSGKAFAFRKNTFNRMTQDDFDRSILKVNDNCWFLKTIDISLSLDDILKKAQELVKRKGINAFLLDPWNYIEQNRPDGASETDYVSKCLSKIKLFCTLNDVHLFLVAHPTKLKKENGKYEVPTMYSISGSAHFYNKTDNGISVYRDFETNIVTVFVQKVRFEWNGSTGFCQFQYNTDTRQYHPFLSPL